MLLTFIFLVSIYLEAVQSACDPKAIEGITKFWANKPPTNLLANYGGTWTIVKISSKDTGVDADLKCFMEVVHGGQSTAKDYWFFSEPKDDFTVDIKQTEKPGIIEEEYVMGKVDYKESTYVLYFDHGVMGFWTCSQDVDGMSAIAVKDYATTENDPKIKEGIQKAEESLKKAGLPDVQGIHTDCPANPEAGGSKKTK